VATSDPFDLQRFVEAQASTYDQALAELHAGAKASHWMWFIFPQLAGLGRSPTAQYYGIRSLDEAQAYFAHPILGPRVVACAEALLPWIGRRSAEQILGAVDAAKLRSSLTLFEAASADPLFGRALDRFYDGKRDPATLALLQNP
jgi:uncharacterized protein (DUF1810 family)